MKKFKVNFIALTCISLILNFTSLAQSNKGIEKGEGVATDKSNSSKNDTITKIFGKSIQHIEINAKNGKVVRKNANGDEVNVNFLRKNNDVEIRVINLSGNQQPIFVIVQDDVSIDGDAPTPPIKPEDFAKDEVDPKEVQAIEKSISDLEGKVTNINLAEDLKKQSQKSLDSLKLLRLKLVMTNSLRAFSEEVVFLSSTAERDSLLMQIDKKVLDFSSTRNKLLALQQTLDYSKVEELFDNFNLLKLKIDRLTFEKYYNFNPEKEEVKLTVKLSTNDGNETTTKNLYDAKFITRRRALIFGSVGLHGLVYGKEGSTIYSNRDSILVSGKGNSITPSFGTYLNIAWRGNDFMGGFGIGSGIPINIDGSTDLTPNFSFFGTLIFPGKGGRFGINAGVAIHRSKRLAPGYQTGDNLGSTDADVPLVNKWSPAFMFGVTYNLIKD